MSRTPKPRPVYWVVGLSLALIALSLAAVGLLAVRIDRVGEPAFVSLTWNLFLAWIPFVLSLCVAAVHGRGGPRPLLWVLGAAWLLFLPNAPYILTDFIHLAPAAGVPLWLDAGLISMFAFTGLLLGYASLYLVQAVVRETAGAFAAWTAALGALGLASVGIYLGRFVRLNSWDFFTNPHHLAYLVRLRLADPFGNPRLIAVVVTSTLMLGAAYLLVYTFASAGLRLELQDPKRR